MLTKTREDATREGTSIGWRLIRFTSGAMKTSTDKTRIAVKEVDASSKKTEKRNPSHPTRR